MILADVPFGLQLADWDNKLTDEEKRVILNKGTEKPFTGKLNDHYEEGIYTCAQCGGTGYFVIDVPTHDKRFGTAQPCPCKAPERAERKAARLDDADGLLILDRLPHALGAEQVLEHLVVHAPDAGLVYSQAC